MTCEEAQHYLIDVSEEGPEVRAALQQHIAGCGECAVLQAELDHLAKVMERAPEALPGPGLEKQFRQMLRTAEQEQKAQRPISRLNFWRNMAAAVVLLAAGIGIGIRLASTKAHEEKPDRPLAAMHPNAPDTLLFSLLKEESASERIKAVNYAEEMTSPDQKVINALINTLDHDKNANVRLACLYSLTKFAEDPHVREALVNSLPLQTEPIVQIVLINLLTEMKESRARRPLQDIISDEKTSKEVKNIAEKGLRSI